MVVVSTRGTFIARLRAERRGSISTLAGLLLLAAPGCYSGLGLDGRDSAADGGPAGGDAGGSAEGGSGDSGGNGEVDDPGRITLHRLNRAEYDNTIRDLFWGLDLAPASVFPADDHSYGFDNIADVLSVTPLLFELYERATEDVLDAAFTSTGGGSATTRGEAETGTGDVGSASGSAWALSSNGSVSLPFDVAQDGSYTIRVHAWGQQAGPDLPNLDVLVDGASKGMAAVDAVAATPGDYEFTVDLTSGSHTIAAAFTNDYYDEAASLDRNLYIDWIELEGPLGLPPGPGDIRAKLLTCAPQVGDEATCSREVLGKFAERAWRRPLETAELDGLVELAESARTGGDAWEDSIRLALKYVLLSPHFIFRVELDPDPTDPTPHPVTNFELASRLSYFLWSSMPDDELLAAAKAGTLDDPAEIEAQVLRMLADPKADALVENFAGQWLYSRAVDSSIVKNPTYYPGYSTELNASMRTEMELFFQSFIDDGRSLRELLTSDTTFVDAGLAELYGLPAPATPGFSEVSIGDAPRAGLLTMAGLMTVLSHPDTSSPVKRGKWVLEQLLCIPPAPPPPGVNPVPPVVDPNSSVREQLAAHRADPACAACHNLIDPIGLGLEHYDAIGAYRLVDGGKAVDASGYLPDGTDFADGLEMAELVAQSEGFAQCTVRHAAIYALGRGVELSDQPYLDDILGQADAAGFAMQDLAIAIATSDMFRMRRGEEP